MKNLCVFLGAHLGKNPSYLEGAKLLGKELAKRNITLIYGGGKLGLMGAIANTVLENDGKVIGVITKDLYEQEAHFELSELHIVRNIPERKKQMLKLADGFIGLPGGLGTMEEIFEICNASKLKVHNKPLGLLNTHNYFTKLVEFLDYSLQEGFLKRNPQELIKVSNDPIELLNMLISSKCCF